MSQLFSLRGRTALVTGASRGMGREIAFGFAQAGASLIVAARDAERLEAFADELRATGAAVRSIAFDLGDLSAVEAAIDRLNRDGVAVDVLVNNGGISEWAPLHSTSLEAWEHMFDVNTSSMFLLCREFSRGMMERRWGRIINFSSYVAQIGRPNLSAYIASKTAVLGLTRALAAELAAYDVTCNAIAPGFFATEMTTPIVGHPERSRVYSGAIALGRFGAPADIVGPVLFLASDAGAYVTGHMLPVDGGLSGVLSLSATVTA